VASVLEHTPPGYRLVLIDDASPDPGVRAVFEEIAAARHPHVTLSPTTATSASPGRRTAAWRCRATTSCS
jgi:hypothetical protein